MHIGVRLPGIDQHRCGIGKGRFAAIDRELRVVAADFDQDMAMRVGSVLFMASDTPGDYYQSPQGFSVALHVTSAQEADRIYGILSNGALSVMMPLGETFWADKYAMLTDKYGTPWMINFTGAKA